MSIGKIQIDPPLSNPFPAVDLIIEFVKKCHKSDEKIDIDIRQLSGGLSGAIVALVNHSNQRHVVKVDRIENVIKDISTYQNGLANIVDNSQEAKKRMALLNFPSVEIRQKGMDNVEKALICKKGYDNEEYSIHCYSYAKEDNIQGKLWPLDEWIRDNIGSQDKMKFKSDFESLMSILSDTLRIYFYDRAPEKKNFRKFALPAIPWGQFLPVACTAASLHPGWMKFINELPVLWQDITANQETESINFYLSHGDLRCANIMVTMNKISELHPFLIDFGMTAFEHPMYDFARLESDMVQRILLSSSEEDIRSVIIELTESNKFNPDRWNDASCSYPILKMIYTIRSFAEKLFDTIANDQKLNCYELFLLGHGTRMIRNDDPKLRNQNTRFLYLWYILRLFERVIDRYGSKYTHSELGLPIDRRNFQNLEKWQIKQLYHGSVERNKMKKKVIENDVGPIRLIAHTAHSYLDSTVNRFYDSLLKRLLRKTDNSIHIVILNPFSLEGSKLGIAEARGLLQGPEVDTEYHEKYTEFFSRFRTCMRSYKDLRDKYPNVKLRITHYSPDATILLSKDNAFIEPYLIGNVYLRYHGEITMTVPEYLVPKDSYLYKIAEDQFSFFWQRAISVNEYETREAEFKKEFMRSERLRRKIVSLHESWYAIDPIVGCPNRCAYCFLTPYRINNKMPFIYRTAKDSYERLNENKWFIKQFEYLKSIKWKDARLPVPVACGNYTEMVNSKNYEMFESSQKNYTRKTNNLKELRRIVQNHCTMCRENSFKKWPILCIITKQLIPAKELVFFEEQLKNELHLKISFFVSLSFLSSEIEQGAASIASLLKNFANIAKIQRHINQRYPNRDRQIAGIHFWRPLIAGINDDKIEDKIDRVKNAGALSSVAIGLKLSEKLLNYLKSHENTWYPMRDMLSTYDIEKNGYELLITDTRNEVVNAGKNAQHPIFLNTSCAIAHAFSFPDYNATFNQIKSLSRKKIDNFKGLLQGVGLSDDEFLIFNDCEFSYIEIKVPIEQELQTYLRQSSGIEILVSGNLRTTHEWRGNTSRLTKGEYCSYAHCPENQRSICLKYYQEISEVSANE